MKQLPAISRFPPPPPPPLVTTTSFACPSSINERERKRGRETLDQRGSTVRLKEERERDEKSSSPLCTAR